MPFRESLEYEFVECNHTAQFSTECTDDTNKKPLNFTLHKRIYFRPTSTKVVFQKNR